MKSGSSTPPMSFMTCIMGGSERARLCRSCVCCWRRRRFHCRCRSPDDDLVELDVGDGLSRRLAKLSRCSSMRSWKAGWAPPQASMMRLRPRPSGQDLVLAARLGSSLAKMACLPLGLDLALFSLASAATMTRPFRFGRRLELRPALGLDALGLGEGGLGHARFGLHDGRLGLALTLSPS